jgi:hypothetical protein
VSEHLVTVDRKVFMRFEAVSLPEVLVRPGDAAWQLKSTLDNLHQIIQYPFTSIDATAYNSA